MSDPSATTKSGVPTASRSMAIAPSAPAPSPSAPSLPVESDNVNPAGEKSSSSSDSDSQSESEDWSGFKQSIKIKMFEFKQNDPKMDTGMKLVRFHQAESIAPKTKFNGLILSSESNLVVSPADRGLIELHGISGINCSWNKLEKIPFAKLGKLQNHRLLPFLVAANTINYGRPMKLSTAEAIAAVLEICGYRKDARYVLSKFGWGPEFWKINKDAFRWYRRAKNSDDMKRIQKEFCETFGSKKKEGNGENANYGEDDVDGPGESGSKADGNDYYGEDMDGGDDDSDFDLDEDEELDANGNTIGSAAEGENHENVENGDGLEKDLQNNGGEDAVNHSSDEEKCKDEGENGEDPFLVPENLKSHRCDRRGKEKYERKKGNSNFERDTNRKESKDGSDKESSAIKTSAISSKDADLETLREQRMAELRSKMTAKKDLTEEDMKMLDLRDTAFDEGRTEVAAGSGDTGKKDKKEKKKDKKEKKEEKESGEQDKLANDEDEESDNGDNVRRGKKGREHKIDRQAIAEEKKKKQEKKAAAKAEKEKHKAEGKKEKGKKGDKKMKKGRKGEESEDDDANGESDEEVVAEGTGHGDQANSDAPREDNEKVTEKVLEAPPKLQKPQHQPQIKINIGSRGGGNPESRPRLLDPDDGEIQLLEVALGGPDLLAELGRDSLLGPGADGHNDRHNDSSTANDKAGKKKKGKMSKEEKLQERKAKAAKKHEYDNEEVDGVLSGAGCKNPMTAADFGGSQGSSSSSLSAARTGEKAQEKSSSSSSPGRKDSKEKKEKKDNKAHISGDSENLIWPEIPPKDQKATLTIIARELGGSHFPELKKLSGNALSKIKKSEYQSIWEKLIAIPEMVDSAYMVRMGSSGPVSAENLHDEVVSGVKGATGGAAGGGSKRAKKHC